jgi:sRNA-binding protein
VSKQRAQRRAERLALQQQEAKAAREAKQARSRQRRGERHTTRSGRGRDRGRGRVGFAGMRRSRQQRIGITAVAVGGVALLWILAALRVLDVGLAIALTVLFLVALPAFVVLALGRRY